MKDQPYYQDNPSLTNILTSNIHSPSFHVSAIDKSYDGQLSDPPGISEARSDLQITSKGFSWE